MGPFVPVQTKDRDIGPNLLLVVPNLPLALQQDCPSHFGQTTNRLVKPKIHPIGFEPDNEYKGETENAPPVGSLVGPSEAIELLSIWAKLDEPARRGLLAMARGLIEKRQQT